MSLKYRGSGPVSSLLESVSKPAGRRQPVGQGCKIINREPELFQGLVMYLASGAKILLDPMAWPAGPDETNLAVFVCATALPAAAGGPVYFFPACFFAAGLAVFLAAFLATGLLAFFWEISLIFAL